MTQRRRRRGWPLWIAATAAAGLLYWWVSARSFHASFQEAHTNYVAGYYGRAVEIAEQLHADHPNNQAVLRLLARACAGSKDLPRCADLLVQLAAPTADDRKLLALTTAELNRLDASAAAWRTAGAVEFSAAHEALRDYFRALLDADQGTRLYELAIRLDRDGPVRFPIAHTMLAALARKNGRQGEAAAQFEKAWRASKQPTQKQRMEFAAALLTIGAADEAGRLLEDAVSAEATWLRSRVALQQGRVDEAERLLGELRKRWPGEIPAGIRPEPAPLAGHTACAECHQQRVESQSATHHAHTFTAGADVWPADHPLAEWFADPMDPRIEHRKLLTKKGVQTETRRGDTSQRLLIQGRLGSGARGWTFLGADADQMREFRLSVYRDVGFDVTTGQEGKAATESMSGRRLHLLESDACLRCHNTDTQAARASRAGPAGPLGVRCESCHGPGAHHVAAAKLGLKSDWAVRNPALLSAEQSVEICAQCHQPDGKVDPTDVKSVRFQSASLRASECFKQSESLTCITCHSPHHDARRSPSFYDQKCVSCHQPVTEVRCQSQDIARGGSCITCHMPKTAGAMRHTLFSDHFIRRPSRKSP